MKADSHVPETPATKFLQQHRVAHSNHLYDYEEHGGTKVSSRELNVPEHHVVKTLVMEDEATLSSTSRTSRGSGSSPPSTSTSSRSYGRVRRRR